jgi:hypothetical protein
MGKFDKSNFEVDVEEVIGVLKENDKNDWCKAVARISWNGNPATLDIRNFNMAKQQPMKGISLSDEEADRLVDILLESDFGSLDTLTKAVERKKSRFTVMGETNNCFDEEEPYVIQINL